MTTQAQVNANQSNQTTNQKGTNTMTNTNKATNFTVVNSTQAVSTTDRSKHVFPVQVRMTLNVNGKSQSVAFGYNRLGGRQTYVVAAGKAPVVMSRSEFINTLTSSKIGNMKQVQYHLSQLRSFKQDEFVVAKCDCCATGLVTAANIDFIQRNHAALSTKLNKEVTAFAKLCYVCQGREAAKPKAEPTTPATPATTTTSIPATATHATCVDCGSEVKSHKVAQFSVKQYGKVLCYKPCQSKHTKLNTSTKSTTPPAAKQEQAPQSTPSVSQPAAVVAPERQDVIAITTNDLITPAFLAEIMALDVDAYSAIGIFQREASDLHIEHKATAATIWSELHTDHVAKIVVPVQTAVEPASVASVSTPVITETTTDLPFADDTCFVCEKEMPAASEWKHDLCPACSLPKGHSFDMPLEAQEAAIAFFAQQATELQEEMTVATPAPIQYEVATPEIDQDTREFLDEAARAYQDAQVPPMENDEVIPF